MERIENKASEIICGATKIFANVICNFRLLHESQMNFCNYQQNKGARCRHVIRKFCTTQQKSFSWSAKWHLWPQIRWHDRRRNIRSPWPSSATTFLMKIDNECTRAYENVIIAKAPHVRQSVSDSNSAWYSQVMLIAHDDELIAVDGDFIV